MKNAAQRIAEARYKARVEWLDAHQEASGDSYGHAHATMAQVEMLMVEDYESPAMLEQAEKHLSDKYGVDVSSLPGSRCSTWLWLLAVALMAALGGVFIWFVLCAY